MNKEKAPLYLGTAVTLIVGILTLWNPLQIIQWKLSDLFFIDKQVSEQITIIGIDDKSVSQEANLGRFADWPRGYYAQLLRSINKFEPAVVTFDMHFPSPSKGASEFRIKQLLRASERGQNINWPQAIGAFESEESEIKHPDDLDFLNALNEGGPVVLGSALTIKEEEKTNSLKAFPKTSEVKSIFSEEKILHGYANTLPDRDGVVRRFQPNTDDATHLSVATVLAYQKTIGANKEEAVAIEPQQEPIRINYTAEPFSFKEVSFSDAINGSIKEEDIKGKIVLVGPYRIAMQDFRATPTASEPMFGIEIHANIIQQLLENKSLTEVGKIGSLLLVILMSFIGMILFLKLPLRSVWIAFGGGIILYVAVVFGLQQVGYILNVIYPLLAWISAFGASLWFRNITEFREKRKITDAFSHYVSPVIVNQIANNADILKLGGKREKISIMFSDIVGFTSIAEKLTPEETVALLNNYLGAMSEVIFGFNGTLDKFQGDAIMAMFGAPLPDDNHAVNACQTALGMRKVLATLHERWSQIAKVSRKDLLTKLDFRVGIASGDAVVGNVGSQKRFDYTAIGDIVNLGSRLESINRKYGTQVIVDKNTFTQITAGINPFIFRKLDMVRVKGKQEVTEIFELISLKEQLKEEMKVMLDDFENGRILYTQRNFQEAKQYFEVALNSFPHDGPANIYLNRCSFFIRKPPPRTWDAIVDMDEK